MKTTTQCNTCGGGTGQALPCQCAVLWQQKYGRAWPGNKPRLIAIRHGGWVFNKASIDKLFDVCSPREIQAHLEFAFELNALNRRSFYNAI